MAERLQKLIAAAGICSRRGAEDLLRAGRVQVNGATAGLGDRADLSADTVTVDGRPLGAAEAPVYVILNKPRGYVTTLSDEKGRATVADLVREIPARLCPVGRLDLQSEGLLLMTNDGALIQQLIHPKFEIAKTYLLSVYGEAEHAVQRLGALRDLEGEPIRPAEVQLVRKAGNRADLLITIHEGKNRQIRRMCTSCGLGVKRLMRIQEHNLKLGELESGKWRYLTPEEVRSLKQC